MNYRHQYHAGSFSDVFKHIILLDLLEALKRKDKPICYLETHAGAGEYDLTASEALKTKEYENGILKLFNTKSILKEKENRPKKESRPKIVDQYLSIVEKQSFPQYYPGSPLIAKASLRPIDRMILMELHPEEYSKLKNLFFKDSQVSIHHLNGYQGLKAFLPPKERRGLILIDPPFEKETEIQDLIHHLTIACRHFSNGVYAIWYPLKDKSATLELYEGLKHLQKLYQLKMLITEINIYPEDISGTLSGCGMAVINPPWEWTKNFSDTLSWLWKVLSVNGQGSYGIQLNS